MTDASVDTHVMDVSEKDGRYRLYAFEDSHAGMLAARRMADSEYGRDWNMAWRRSWPEDETLFEAYWDWMRQGRYTFAMSDEGRMRWIITADASTLHGGITDGSWHRALAYADAAIPPVRDAHEAYDRIACHLLGVDPADLIGGDCAGWMDRECNRWADITCGQESFRHSYPPLYGNKAREDCIRLAMSDDWRERLAVASSDIIDYAVFRDMLGMLSRDECVAVRTALARNTCQRDDRIMERLAEDPDWRVRRSVCQNGRLYINYRWMCGTRLDNFSGGIIRRLAHDPEYEVRLAAAEVIVNSDRGGEHHASVSAVLDSPYDDDFKADVAVGIASGEYTDGNDEVTAYFMRRSYAMVNANVIGLASKHMGV